MRKSHKRKNKNPHFAFSPVRRELRARSNSERAPATLPPFSGSLWATHSSDLLRCSGGMPSSVVHTGGQPSTRASRNGGPKGGQRQAPPPRPAPRRRRQPTAARAVPGKLGTGFNAAHMSKLASLLGTLAPGTGRHSARLTGPGALGRRAAGRAPSSRSRARRRHCGPVGWRCCWGYGCLDTDAGRRVGANRWASCGRHPD
jgi:hypothetical protein